MSHLPSLKGKQVIKALNKTGFVERRTTGSHCVLRHQNGKIVVVPLHGSKDIKRGTLFNIIKQAGLKVEEFVELLK